MTLFRYEALREDGVLERGQLDAKTEEELVASLRGKQLVPLTINKLASARKRQDKSKRSVFTSRQFSPASFLRDLGLLLEGGLPLVETLTEIGSLARSKTETTLVTAAVAAVRSGQSLSSALMPFQASLPSHIVPLIGLAEKTGRLGPTATTLATDLERTLAIRANVRSSLVYPMIILATTFLALLFLILFVVPQFETLFNAYGTSPPAIVAFLLGIGRLVEQHALALLLGLAGMTLVGSRAMRSTKMRQTKQNLLLSIPVVGPALLGQATTQSLRALASALEAGMPLLAALELSAGITKVHSLSEALKRSARTLRSGGSLSVAFSETTAVPPLVIQFVRIGERTGRLAPALRQVTSVLDDQVKRTTSRLVALLIPTVTLGLGLLVGGIVASILSAILDAYDLPL